MKVKSLSRVQLLATPWTAAAPASMGCSRQESTGVGCHNGIIIILPSSMSCWVGDI